MLVPISQCFQSASVFSLHKSTLLLLSGHKAPHHIPIQANTSNSSHRQAGIECSSPWPRHESALSGRLPSWKHSLEQMPRRNAGSALVCKLQGKPQQSYQKHCKCCTGIKEEFLATKATWNSRQSGLKRHGSCVSIGSLQKTRQGQQGDFSEKGNAPCPYLPTPTELFWSGCFQDVKPNLLQIRFRRHIMLEANSWV